MFGERKGQISQIFQKRQIPFLQFIIYTHRQAHSQIYICDIQRRGHVHGSQVLSVMIESQTKMMSYLSGLVMCVCTSGSVCKAIKTD